MFGLIRIGLSGRVCVGEGSMGIGSSWIRLVAAVGVSGLVPTVYGQDFVDGMGGSVFDSIETISSSPTNPLPGHEAGDRERREDDVDESGEVDEGEAVDELGEWFGGLDWWDWTRGTGDWGGVRTGLEDSGITVEGAFVGDWFTAVSGGVNHHSEFLHLIDVNLSFDLDVIAGVRGGSLFVDFYTARHESISANVGDLQGISNIETGVDRTQIAELWYEQWLFGDRVRVKVGKVDANSEFAFVESAGEFITSSAGVSPAVFVIPTYPDPATSVNVFVYPTDEFYIGFGVYDGAGGVDGVPTGSRGPGSFFNENLSDDYFYIAEAGLSWEQLGDSFGPGRLAAGGWHHSGHFMRFGGGFENGTSGWYGLVEQRVWSRGSGDDVGDEDEGGLNAFFQFGQADSDVSEVDFHLACGLFLDGTFAGRGDDSAGVYVSFADLSRAGGFVEDETVVEAFYRVQLTESLSVKPDLQWIVNPSGDPAATDVVAMGMRVEFVF